MFISIYVEESLLTKFSLSLFYTSNYKDVPFFKLHGGQCHHGMLALLTVGFPLVFKNIISLTIEFGFTPAYRVYVLIDANNPECRSRIGNRSDLSEIFGLDVITETVSFKVFILDAHS